MKKENKDSFYLLYSKFFCVNIKAYTGRLAQLVRAPALQAGGHWFESSNAHHNLQNLAMK